MFVAMVQLGLVLVGVVAGNVVFDGFERHLSWWRRVGKHGLLFAVLVVVRLVLGGWALLAVLVVLTVGQVVLHAWWFPSRGVHWRTAEPRDRYLELIGELKGQR